MRQLLEPIHEYFNCSPTMGHRFVTPEDFIHEVTASYGMQNHLRQHDSKTADFAPVQVKHAKISGDLHRGVTPSLRMQASIRRRKLATKFLSAIVSERDPFVKEKVQDWIEASSAVTAMIAQSTDMRIGDDTAEGQNNGLLLGITRPHKADHSSERGSAGSEAVKRDPVFTLHSDMMQWSTKEDAVQPLVMRVGGVPIFGTSYVQTFETRAEKAEKLRLEKREQERDALGVTLWDGRGAKRQNTLRSIRATIKLRRDWKKQASYYRAVLETPSVFRIHDDTSREGRNESLSGPAGEGEEAHPDRRHDQSEATVSAAGTTGTSETPVHEEYDPNLLDDPEIKSEKKRKVLVIPSLRVTVIPYSKPKDLKKDLNQQFLLTHPWIEETGLSLTGIRKAKNIMINLALKDDPAMEAATVAYAVVYFEWLILNQYKHVTKKNRKLVASICCVLAFKFWESDTGSTRELSMLLNDLEERFDVPKQKILESEFAVYALLKFDLLVPLKTAETHFERLLALYNITAEEYHNEMGKKGQKSWGLKLREEGTTTVVKMTN
eukprot:TRINITY_DN1097_c0_g1_i2.p1 TRINITY_DN1097_c0_g1~~TRINITY_DN1097_c0_g1_i2.p1  ORF type:complete len:644 (+),score=249.03 TRINITY_DN1097_c0_g1_i2:285-1934(+)